MAPSQASLTSISCNLKDGDPKTVELSISGSDIPDGEYRLVLKDEVSTKETVLKISFVNSEGRMDIEIFSTSELEYGAEYEVMSLSSSSVTVALPTDATKRLVDVPAPSRVRSATCLVGGEMKRLVEVVICGENLPVGETLSVKVKEVGSTGSTLGSEIALPSTTIGSKTRTEGISIEVYEAEELLVEYGKTFELTSLTISGTTSWILDECVRFSVPCEPVRVTSASCTKVDVDKTVVSVDGSGFVLGEFYTVSVSGHPIGSPSTPSSSLHNTSFVVVASSAKKAGSSALQLHASEGSELKFSYSYSIVGMTNGTESEDGVIEGGQFKTPTQASLTSISCDLKDGDPKTVELSISGSDIPDGEYRLVLKDEVSTKETVLKISFVNSEGRMDIEIFSTSELEYGAEYEVMSLSSSSVTVVLQTDATARLMKVPGVPARIQSVSCVLTEDLKTHVEVEICGENLPVGKELTVKVKEVDPSSGSLIGSEIALASTPIASTTQSEPIEIEVYDVSNPCLKYGKTYELTSLAISDTTSFILDESVRFSVPSEPVRIESASCTTGDPNWTVVSVDGSGFVSGEFYTVSVSGHPISSPSTPSSSLHNTSFVVIAESSSKKATSSPLQLHPSEESQLKFSYSYSIVGVTNGSVEGVVHSVMFETQPDINRDEALVTKIEIAENDFPMSRVSFKRILFDSVLVFSDITSRFYSRKGYGRLQKLVRSKHGN
ncbi:hypothetical protein BLNAU_20758 [Blattamonas nauphoetae]|uniref:Uncharacterized protein n=1 Tax=Blattamonas nauphoetae TaxID=2049346 RepID=A0ABQ9WYB8_9EUKA|nr:hypothetical protein BLNAU_20758 [Blattamonas nauphoetae]